MWTCLQPEGSGAKWLRDYWYKVFIDVCLFVCGKIWLKLAINSRESFFHFFLFNPDDSCRLHLRIAQAFGALCLHLVMKDKSQTTKPNTSLKYIKHQIIDFFLIGNCKHITSILCSLIIIHISLTAGQNFITAVVNLDFLRLIANLWQIVGSSEKNKCLKSSKTQRLCSFASFSCLKPVIFKATPQT